MMYDWMHIYLVSGLWHLEVKALVDELILAKIKQQDLRTVFKSFSWPGSMFKVNHRGCSSRRERPAATAANHSGSQDSPGHCK